MIEEHDHEYRSGIGTDIHRLAEGRKLMPGGVEVPYPAGLIGHSDGDVVLHAVIDALLGAANLGDIGQHFPPSDDRYKDADSGDLLSQVVDKLHRAGFGTIGNIDCTVMAERPKLASYIDSIGRNIARLLRVDQSRVSVKATTCEQLGFVGREEGLAASAVCLIVADE